MAIIVGTQLDDDGITNPILQAQSVDDIIYGFAGNDVLRATIGFNLGSVPTSPFEPMPTGKPYTNVLYGGTGNDTYISVAPVSFPIYSTPILWGSLYGVLEIHEEISTTDTADILDITAFASGFAISSGFDGKNVYIVNSTMMNNYGVDSEGNLLSGVDFVNLGTLIDTKLESSLFSFIKNGTSASEILTGSSVANVIDGRDGDDTVYGNGGNDFITGGRGNDVIYADEVTGSFSDIVYGGSGDDIIYAYGGNDNLYGMSGNDQIFGGEGNDSYFYEGYGDGHDVIQDDAGATDSISFGSGITTESLIFEQLGNDLKISFVNHPEASLTIVNQFGGTGGRIETIFFSDGTTLNLAASGNLLPIANDDIFSVIQGATITANLLQDNGNGVDSDPDGDDISVNPVSFVTANGGTVSIDAFGEMTYISSNTFVGTDTFDYTLIDAFGGESTGTVIIDVVLNVAPDAKNDYFSINEDQQLSGNLLQDNGSGEDTDANNETLTLEEITLTTLAGGIVTIHANGDFTYNPADNYFGSDSFEYLVTDLNGATDTATVHIEIASVNDAPDAKNDHFVTSSNTQVKGNVLVSNMFGADFDVDGDALSVVSGVFQTVKGNTVKIGENGQFVLTSKDGYLSINQDSFVYTLKDQYGATDTATVTVKVSAPAGSIVGTSAKQDLIGTASDDTIFGLGGNDRLYGQAGNDKLYGDDGIDKLYGGIGNDRLFGGSGDDFLYAEDGNDLLVGGQGADFLRGYAGADTFKFTAIEAGIIDNVYDFKKTQNDKLDISSILEGYDPLTSLITDYVQITTVGTNSILSVDSNGSAGGSAFVQVAQITGVTGITDEQSLLTSGHLIVV